MSKKRKIKKLKQKIKKLKKKNAKLKKKLNSCEYTSHRNSFNLNPSVEKERIVGTFN